MSLVVKVWLGLRKIEVDSGLMSFKMENIKTKNGILRKPHYKPKSFIISLLPLIT